MATKAATQTKAKDNCQFWQIHKKVEPSTSPFNLANLANLHGQPPRPDEEPVRSGALG